MSAASAPFERQKIHPRKTSNIHRGADAVDATDELHEHERRSVVDEAARVVPGPLVADFDLLIPRRLGEGDPAILEVNPFSMISMCHFPADGQSRDVVASIVDAMFHAG